MSVPVVDLTLLVADSRARSALTVIMSPSKKTSKGKNHAQAHQQPPSPPKDAATKAAELLQRVTRLKQQALKEKKAARVPLRDADMYPIP